MLLLSSGFARVHSGGPSCCYVHSSSLGFTRAQLEVVGFILVRIASRLAVVGFFRVREGSLRPVMWSGSFMFAWVNLGAPSGRRVDSGSLGFTWAGIVDIWFIRVPVGSLGGC